MNARRPFLWAFLAAALLHGGLWFAFKAPALPSAAIAHRDAETLIALWDESDEAAREKAPRELPSGNDTQRELASLDGVSGNTPSQDEASPHALREPSLSEPGIGVLSGDVGATAEPHLGAASQTDSEDSRRGATGTTVTDSEDSRRGATGATVTDSEDSRRGATGSDEAHSAVPRQTDTQESSPGKGDKPELSLAQAGYGTPSPWVLPKQAATKATAEDRLQRNLAEGTMRDDYQRSMGIEGPVVAAINRAAWGHVPPRSKAHLSVTVDGTGRVVAIDVVQTNSDMARYRELASATLAALRSVKLRVPEGRQVVLTFQVESQVLMPSGRKPQRGVSILGVPLGDDDGKHEPMVKILSPEFGVDKMKVPKPTNPDEEVELPTLKMGLNLLALNPDLVDVGAVSRQVVHTKLVGQRIVQ